MQQFRRFFILILIFFSNPTFSQMMKWLVRDTFGQSYLVDFSTPIPTVSSTAAGYGYSVALGDNEDNNIMTDASNNILFTYLVYMNNLIEVRDAGYNVMPNGTGLLCNNSTQESAVVRIPCTTNKYYLVHSSVLPSNLYYSVVDMSLNSGNGDVIRKNTLIGNNIGEGKTVSHQLPTGCRWLIVPEIISTTQYHILRYLISDVGIGSPTVIATVTFNQTFNYGPYELELSPDNTKLAFSTHRDNPNDPDIIVWDFDFLSGTVSNRVDWSVSTDQIHGIEWSPDNSKLYYVGNVTTDDADFGRINFTANAVELIDPLMGRYIGVIELAGNGRLYVSPNYNQDYLAEVANPNASTIAGIGYNHNGVFISASGMRSSLPSAIQGELPGTTTTPAFIWFEATTTGNCSEYMFRDSSCLGTWWEWNFGDGTTSNNEITTHHYSNSGTYDVTLRMVACGDTLVLTKPAYIHVLNSNPDANFQSSNSLCQGELVQFTNTSINANNYQWNFGDGTNATGFSQTHTYNSQGSFTITLIAIDTVSGCRDTITNSVNINRKPVCSFNTQVNSCNLQVGLTNSSQFANSYLWQFGDGTTSNNQNPTHVYTNVGPYTIVLIATDSTTGCRDTSNQNININNPTTGNFTFSLDTCSLNFTGNNTSQNANSYTWTFGDGNSNSQSNPVHTYLNSGTYSVQLIASNSTTGCRDTITQSITFPPLPSSSFTYQVTPCSANVQFTNTSTSGSNSNWNFGDGISGTGTNAIHNYSSSGQFNVSLVTTSNYGCSDTAQNTIQLPTLPTADFTYSIPPCTTAIQFSNQSSNYTLQNWNFSDGTTDQNVNPNHNFPASGTHTATLIITDANGCSDTLSSSILIEPKPTSDFIIDIDTCKYQVRLINQSSNSDSFVWYFGDQSTGTNSNESHQYINPGDYTIQLNALTTNGCMDSLQKSINLAPLPNADFQLSYQTCDSVIQLFNLSSASSSYSWDFGDGNTSNQQNPSNTYTSSGNYDIQLFVESQESCKDSITKNISVIRFTPAYFEANIDSCNGELVLTSVVDRVISYEWIFNSTDTSKTKYPSFEMPLTGTSFPLSLTVNENTPCSDKLTRMIVVNTEIGERIFIPNAFTPNGDGINDIFKLYGRSNCDTYTFDIFNRWGEQILHAEDALDATWDGTYLNSRSPEGIYVYLLRGNNIQKTGMIMLTR